MQDHQDKGRRTIREVHILTKNSRISSISD
jgi:hypothetical protein